MRATVITDSQGMSSNTKSTLVQNAQPMGVSERPDSNV
jgi:hypothetical protein